MAEEHLSNLIDGIRARLHEELDVQLASMTATHARAVEEARHAGEAAAEHRSAALIETARAEWNARLESEVATVRADANRSLIAETMRARVEAEQAAAESASAARRELEQALAAERQRLDALLAAECRRTSELEADGQRTAADLDAQRQRVSTLEAERQGTAAELEGERHRIAELEAERHRSAGEIEAQRRRVAELEGERQRNAELEAGRQRLVGELEAQLVAERQRADAQVQSARAHAQIELDAERQRQAGELEAQLVAERQHADAQVHSAREHAQVELDAERHRGARALTDAHAAFDEERTRTAPLVSAPVAGEADASSRFLDAIRALDEAATLTEVLGAAVRGAAAQAPRAAVFVLHGTELREWPVAGVPSVNSAPLRVDGGDAGVIAEAMRRNQPAATGGPDGSSAPAFALLPPDGVALAVPLVLGGTPVAVLYADERGDGRAPGTWQDNVQILGRHAAACAASITAVRTAQAMRLMSGDSSGAASPVSDPGQDDVHAARRYARLLVSEIKLYNESAVRLGRERRDLLLRLEPEIERARRLYDERVASSVNGRDTLFEQELAQTLADGDPSLLGEPGHQRASW